MRKKKLSFLYDDDGETYIRIKDLQYVMDGAREHYIKSKRADAHKACERGLFEVRKAQEAIKSLDMILKDFTDPIVWAMEDYLVKAKQDAEAGK